ncbi:MAG TPA: response regulator, partial [Chthoniobacterales bacterium]|nr:response regulator [Chthoniobacterales bacterium]
MAIEKVLVIDDEPIIRRSLELQLRGKRLSVSLCSTIAEAERLIARDSFDLMFVDVRLPDGDGTDLLNRLAPSPERPLIVVMTGYGTIESAVNCIRSGAFDYIIKPFSASQIEVILRKADNFNQAVRISRMLAQESLDAAAIIGESRPVQQLRQMIQKVAPTEATV